MNTQEKIEALVELASMWESGIWEICTLSTASGMRYGGFVL